VCQHRPVQESPCDLCRGHGWLPQARTV
jgi:hypothetical protein